MTSPRDEYRLTGFEQREIWLVRGDRVARSQGERLTAADALRTLRLATTRGDVHRETLVRGLRRLGGVFGGASHMAGLFGADHFWRHLESDLRCGRIHVVLRNRELRHFSHTRPLGDSEPLLHDGFEDEDPFPPEPRISLLPLFRQSPTPIFSSSKTSCLPRTERSCCPMLWVR